MLSLGASNSPLSSADVDEEALSTAAVVLIMLITVPLGLSLAIGWSRPSTSCTVPRIVAPQPDRASRAKRGISALAVMFFLRVSRVSHAGARVGDGTLIDQRDANAYVANVALLRPLRPPRGHPETVV